MLFEYSYSTCTSHLYYSGPSPIDSITFSPDCNGEILSDNEIELANFNLYPNPAGDFLRVDFPDNNQVLEAIVFYDLRGRIILSKSGFDIEKGIDISNLPRGLYVVRGRTQDGIFSAKVFKE